MNNRPTTPYKGNDIESKLEKLLSSVRYKNAVKVPNYKFTGQLPAEPRTEKYYREMITR